MTRLVYFTAAAIFIVGLCILRANIAPVARYVAGKPPVDFFVSETACRVTGDDDLSGRELKRGATC